MRILKTNSLLRLFNSYLVDSPQPANISYLWNFGSLLGLCLILQILTGVFLAMHYVPHVDFAFNSVEHIVRDVSNGWIVRYTHANVASFFFICVYAHVGRGIYYGSYKSPRVLVWSIGVIILILMMAIAFLGYVLPYGQMSLWGLPEIALDAYLLFYFFIFIKLQEFPACVAGDTLMEGSVARSSVAEPIKFFYEHYFQYLQSNIISIKDSIYPQITRKVLRIRADKRIGPHNIDILSILFGSLLGDGHAERRIKGNGTRISFYQEASHVSYLLWLHSLLAELGYCNSNKPNVRTRLGNKGIVRKVIRFSTWSYMSLNWVHDLWYVDKVKFVPSIIGKYLTPLALAIWIMDDGGKLGSGLKLATNSFSYSDCMLLTKVLYDNFKIKATIQKAGVPNQYHIYIWQESMSLLREIVLPYIHPSMKYKINI